MSASAQDRTEDMATFVDKYLTEDDKSIVLRKSGRPRSIGNGDQFILHSAATRVKRFIDDGHYVKFIAYGLDYIMIQDSSTFVANSGQMENIDELVDFASAYFFEWYQEGSLNEEALDKAYMWMMITPYVALSMTENARQEMHKAVDYLWMSPVVPDKSLYVQCYDIGKRLIEGSVKHWVENVPTSYSGCGYNNIIRPQEVDA